jgi:hypothetical protein
MKCEEDISQATFPVLSLKARRPCAKIIKLASYTLINQSLSVPPHCFIFATKSKVSCLGWWLVSLNIVPLDYLHLHTSPSLRGQQYSRKPESLSIFQSQTFHLSAGVASPKTIALLFDRWHEESSVDTIPTSRSISCDSSV